MVCIILVIGNVSDNVSRKHNFVDYFFIRRKI